MSSKNKLINFYENKEVKKHFEKKHNPGKDSGLHNIDIEFMALITGPTGSGKSNILINLIKVMNGTFDHITMCLKDSDEPLYNMLIERLKDRITVYEDGEVPSLSSIEKDGQQLFIFDDLVKEKYANLEIEQYYKLGRKKNISCIYLTQSFFQAPKFVRDNIQYLFIKKIRSQKELTAILKDYSFTNVSIDDLKKYYEECTKDFTDFMTIDCKKHNIYHNFTTLLN
jgi:hypothetical protein